MDRCDLEIRVRYAETDKMGYVHHSRYFVYFEMGRTELLRQGGIAYRDLEDAGVFFVIAKAACRFVSPGRYDDVLVLTTKLERMTTARVDHVYELKRQGTGELICTAETTLACVGRDGRPIAIPDNIRGSMES